MQALRGLGSRLVEVAHRIMARSGGVRVRSALAAACIVAVALTVAGVALLLFLQHSFAAGVDANTRQEAGQIVNSLREPGGDSADLAQLPGASNALVQVLDQGGAVMESSPNLAGSPALSSLRPPPGHTATATVQRGQDDDQLYVVAEGVATDQGPRTVLAATSLDALDQVMDAAQAAALLGVPLLVLIAGSATYVFVGRALGPVEVIRQRVSEITAQELDQRIPLPAARDEVHRLAATMNAMLARLEHARRTQLQFVADASHELRSPLSTIVTSLELADRYNELDPASVGALRGEAERMARLVDDLLLLARADEQAAPLRGDELDLDEVLDEELGRLRSRPLPAVEVHITPVRIVGDRGQLVRLVRNLTDNAVRHARSRIAISLELDGPDAVLGVADDGPGIPDEDRDRVFERFVRVDASRSRAAGGTGLGLAIVHEVARAHGGTVQALPAAEGGALLQVRLPTYFDELARLSPRAVRS